MRLTLSDFSLKPAHYNTVKVRYLAAIIASSAALASNASGSYVIAAGDDVDVIDFTGNNVQVATLDTGSAPSLAPTTSSGVLDSRMWRVEGLSDGDTTFGNTFSGGDYSRGFASGSVGTGGMYTFDGVPTTGTAIGFQPTGTDLDGGDGSLTLKIRNDTGATIDAISVVFDGFVRNNAGRDQTITLEYSSDDLTYTDITTVAVDTADYGTGSSGSPAEEFSGEGEVFSGLNLADGDEAFLKWVFSESTGSGSRDEFGFSEITISNTTLGPVGAPEVSTVLPLLGVLSVGLLGHRRRKQA